MKLTINPKEIAPMLKRAERAIATKNIIAILDNFLFEVNNGSMRVTSFDNEVRVTIALPIIESDGEFSFCVDAKKFTQAIGSINSENATIEFDGNSTMVCKHKRGKFNLSYYNGDEYPKADIDQGKSVFLKCGDVRSTISNVAFAVGNDVLHPTMCGVYFDFTKDSIVGVGTDAKMLAKYSHAKGDYSQFDSFIIPLKAVNIISTFMEQCNGEEEIEITNDGKVCEFRMGSQWVIVFRQINGRYPNYNAVFPQRTDNTAKVNRKDLIDSLGRAVLFSPSKTNTIRFHFAQDKIELIAQDIDFNMSSTDEVDCQYNGQEMVIGFNGASILSILSSMVCEEICINLNDPTRAALVYPSDSDDFVSLIMPIMV